MNDIRAEYEALKVNFASLMAAHKELQEKYDRLVEELAWFKRQMFGSKSERYVPSNNGQLALALGASAAPAAVPAPAQKVEAYERTPVAADKKGHGRCPIPAHIKRVDTVLEPVEDVTGMVKIGEDITEELEYTPHTFVVNRTIRPKYAKADGQDTVVVADLPPRIIEKGRPGPGLLAHIMIAKFADHIPFYRQSKQYERSDIHISRSTMSEWNREVSDKLKPLYDRLKSLTLSGKYVQTDESPILILEEAPDAPRGKKNLKKTYRGYFWPYLNPALHCLFFDFRDGRGRAGPEDILKDFKGVLQTDAYGVYESLARLRNGGQEAPVITLSACLAHVRRKFKDALDNDRKRADEALSIIGRLYDIERAARDKNMTAEQRHAFRHGQSAPAIMAEFKAWLLAQAADPAMLPQSLIGKAIAHALNRWDALQVYLTDGEIEIDNNLVENAIRPLALGRKNWMFCGSREGAVRASIMLSLIGTCKMQNIEPFHYLRNLFESLPATPVDRLSELLPIKKS